MNTEVGNDAEDNAYKELQDHDKNEPEQFVQQRMRFCTLLQHKPYNFD